MSWFTDLFVKRVPAWKPEQFNLGANIDTRLPEVAAEQDITAAEVIASAVVVQYKEIPKDLVRAFPIQNQNGKSDCVAETRRKLKRILFKVNKGLDLDFSSGALYRKRRNYPEGGMASFDAIQLDRDTGMTLDALVPSDPIISEQSANAIKPDAYNDDVAQVFRTQSDDIVFGSGDLDTPAGSIQKTRKGVMMWFYFTYNEWAREVPIILDSTLQLRDDRALRHSVTGVEPAMYNGKEGVWIEDSAHFGGLNRRFITRDFYMRRNFWASYPIAFKFEPPVTLKPSYDGSTKSLQDCLKVEGTFPSNVDSTGVYGPLTTQAVKDFQKKYGLEQVGTVGPRTKAKLIELYP